MGWQLTANSSRLFKILPQFSFLRNADLHFFHFLKYKKIQLLADGHEKVIVDGRSKVFNKDYITLHPDIIEQNARSTDLFNRRQILFNGFNQLTDFFRTRFQTDKESKLPPEL